MKKVQRDEAALPHSSHSLESSRTSVKSHSTIMATTMLNHLLSHHLQTNQQLTSSLLHIQHSLTTQRLIQQVEQDTGIQSPILHRWQLRIISLLNPTNSSEIRSAGFKLVLTTFSQSNNLFLQASKQTLTPALQILSNPQLNKLDQGLWLASLEITQFIMAKSTWYPEWARENIGAQTVQKFITSLVQAVNLSTSLQVSSLSFSPFLSLSSRTHYSLCVDTNRIHLDNLYPPPFIPYRTPTALPFPPQPLHHSPLFPYSSIAQRRRIVPIHQPLLVGSKRKRRIERSMEDWSRSFDCELR